MMQTDELITPAWLEKRVKLYSKYLKLKVKVFVKMSYTPGGHSDFEAACIPLPRENSALLEFRPAIRDTEEGRRTIIHELIHALFLYLDREVEDVILPAFDCEKTERIMSRAYEEHLESLVENLVDVFYELFEEKDAKQQTLKNKGK